jgi:LL-diaminopimelate aminotransferase
VVPKDLKASTADGREIPLHGLWTRRWNTRSNGVSYPVQKAAAALYTPQGRAEVAKLVDHYMGNARILRDGVRALGLEVWGGENAPYVWVSCPKGVSSWEMFDRLLREAQVVVTPGAGFGSCGEGFFRISAFNSRANVEEAVRRLAAVAAPAMA